MAVTLSTSLVKLSWEMLAILTFPGNVDAQERQMIRAASKDQLLVLLRRCSEVAYWDELLRPFASRVLWNVLLNLIILQTRDFEANMKREHLFAYRLWLPQNKATLVRKR